MKSSYRTWMFVGLLCVLLAVFGRAAIPQTKHVDAFDFVAGLLAGLGIGLEIMALVKMQKEKRVSS